MKEFKSIDHALKYLYEVESDLLDILTKQKLKPEDSHEIVLSIIKVSSQIISLQALLDKKK